MSFLSIELKEKINKAQKLYEKKLNSINPFLFPEGSREYYRKTKSIHDDYEQETQKLNDECSAFVEEKFPNLKPGDEVEILLKEGNTIKGSFEGWILQNNGGIYPKISSESRSYYSEIEEITKI